MAKREERQRPPAAAGDPSGGGLGALLAAKGLVASTLAAPPSPPAPSAAPAPADPFSGQRRVVLAMERAGRGGRTVTLVRGLDGDDGLLDEAARRLRKAMGTGVVVDGDALVVQGDLRERLRPWLMAAGVRDVRG